MQTASRRPDPSVRRKHVLDFDRGPESTGGGGGSCIVITGANGVVGTALIRRLVDNADPAPQRVRALVRGPAQAAVIDRFPIEVRQVDYGDPEILAEAFHGAAAVAHLAGALQPRTGERLHDANTGVTRSVVSAAKAAGVRRFVYLSAPGASLESPNEYLRSKALAESAIRRAGFETVVFRVPMVLGAGTPSTRTLFHLAGRRVAPLVRGGRVRIQPVALADVTRAIQWALAVEPAPVRVLDLVGPDTLTYVELLRRAEARMDRRPLVVGVPGWLAEAAAVMGGRLGWGWNRTLFDTLFNEHLGDAAETRGLLPFPLTPVDDLLDELSAHDHRRVSGRGRGT